MNVERICTVMKISGCSVLSKEMGPVELKAISNARFELVCASIAANGLQRTEVVSSVEIVDPLL
jgi:hypothetical protein